jgi:hypothetical protein
MLGLRYTQQEVARMAWKEVPDEPVGSKVLKFDAIGSKLHGRFVRKQSRDATFDGVTKTLTEFVFKNTVDGEYVPQSLKNLEQKLLKLERDGNLLQGTKVQMTYTGDQDTGQASKMKVIQVLWDNDDLSQAGVRGNFDRARTDQQRPTPKPAPIDDENIPF